MRFASFLSGGFTTKAVMNPPEKKLKNAPLCNVETGNLKLMSFYASH